ncbi:MAG TPA: hypothetical protein VMV92_36275 [Streptosporangiaceae bacterium]|nr:hypothetical protein [Streptosporangiaceae bacterium]
MAADSGTDQRTTPDPVPAARSAAAGARPQPRVFLHIGEPKTGTTFLQQVMWGNRAGLAAQGVVLPGHHPQDHFRASQDLRGIAKLPSDPAGSWTGEWEILATQARQAPKAAVISHELFSAADEQQAEHAVRSLRPAEVHVVLTVRDMATLLPAEWQETVKHRNARGWEDWLGDVIDRESVSDDRRQWWFWRVHDTLAILGLWSRYVPPERVHVIMTPPQGSGNDVLWQRFAALLEVDPGSIDLSRARPNASLGMPEIEFLRRLNQALPDEVPDWFYMWTVKEGVAHRALAARPRDGRLVLPADRDTWAKEQAETLIAGLGDSGYHLIGDLGELRPRPLPQASVTSPADQPADRILGAAVDAAAALVTNQYRKEHGAKPEPGRGGHGGLAGRVESAVASSPRIKRTVRELSSRYPAVRRLRILAWQALERTRARRSA